MNLLKVTGRIVELIVPDNASDVSHRCEFRLAVDAMPWLLLKVRVTEETHCPVENSLAIGHRVVLTATISSGNCVVRNGLGISCWYVHANAISASP